MHCPSCGQQYISSTDHLRPLPLWRDEIKFCTRCGFPMELVAELLDHGGFLPTLAELDQKKAIFTMKNGVVFSIFWMILLMLIPAIIGIGNGPGEAQGISAVIGLFGGLIIMIGSIILLPSSEQYPWTLNAQRLRSLPATTRGLHGAQHQALPPQQSIPVSVHVPPRAGSWRDTNDLEPSSFTESTTRPLEKEDRH